MNGIAIVALAAAGLLGGSCGGDDDTNAADAADPTTTTTITLGNTVDDSDGGCGVPLADVQALLPSDSGVTENATPDAGRCNFTWDDGGPRGIDVAFVPDARSSFDVPADYEPLGGYGDEAYSSSVPGRASAFAFVADDLYAVDVFADGADDDLSDLCLQLLELVLPE